MPSRTAKIVSTAALAAIVFFVSPGGKLREVRAADARGESQSKTEYSATTQKDQTDLSVTVYNSNIALVRDVRQIRLQPGVFPLRFEDVAASINARHGAFPFADRPFKAERDRAKLRVRFARSAEALAEIRGQGSLVRVARHGNERRCCFQTIAGLSGRSETKSSPASASVPIAFPSCRTIFTAGPRWSGRSTIAVRTRKRWKLPTSPTT